MQSQEFEGDYLLVDAAGPLVQTGLWRGGDWARWTGSREEAGKSLFAGVAGIFREEKISLDELSGFFFCEGPGSMLGIRMAAMAIRGWQNLLASPLPVFAYNSHDLLATSLLTRPVPPPFHVVSDARRNRWNVTSVRQAGTIEPLRRLPAEELSGLEGPLYRMEEVIRNEVPAPASAEILPYNLEREGKAFLSPGVLRRVSSPDSLSLETPEYKRWDAERHR